MPLIQYKEINFQRKSLALIEWANEIVNTYSQQGFNLTLRQLYYQLVSRDIIPNNEKSYDNIGTLVNNGRLAGLIDWHAIEDRTRNLRSLSHWDSPSEILRSAAHSFRLDKWIGQPNYVEVWVEKDALVEIVGRAANGLDVPFFSCRGYVSQSEMWSAAQRLISRSHDHKKLIILHLGDHDPSGIDMTRDIRERLDMFTQNDLDIDCEGINIKRIALNMNQVREYNPPPNPAKLTDSRCAEYIEKYGDSSWELDALEPQVLMELIQEQIKRLMKIDKYNQICKQEQKHIDKLLNLAENYK